MQRVVLLLMFYLTDKAFTEIFDAMEFCPIGGERLELSPTSLAKTCPVHGGWIAPSDDCTDTPTICYHYERLGG